MTQPTYYDSLSTTERMTHSAILERHDLQDTRLAELKTIALATAAGVKNLMLAVEAIAAYEDTRLFRALRWLRLI